MAKTSLPQPLRGVRVLSVALNLPGPAALMRCVGMGARCSKLEPPAPAGAAAGISGDPMSRYSQSVFATLHQGVKRLQADLKTERGQQVLLRELARTDVLLTSFRPSALEKLGLGWKRLHKLFPTLSQVAIVGAPGERAEEPGHDLTYLADNGLIAGLELPPTLYADMGGSLLASEAVLQAVLLQRTKGKGVKLEVALSDAAAWLALPHSWGLTAANAALGGAHAGYRLYPCKDGRVAVAAIETHFAAALCAAAGVETVGAKGNLMLQPSTHEAVAAFFLGRTRRQLDRIAAEKDLPLHTMA